jgi:probable F420-dependent oxidoreductase
MAASDLSAARPMNHCVVFPLLVPPYERELVTGDAVARVARAAEQAGFGGISFTDHPAPSHKWLMAGGHDAFDPFAVLSYVAAATTRLWLIPHVVVLPYRNPFVVAKAAATVDVLSGGRFVLSVAAGYLRSEYRAVGVDFAQRNELFDEALEVLRGVWRDDEFSHHGTHFVAEDIDANPKPDHVPIWIGGNTARARARVARFGDGWSPFPASAQLAKTARTRPLETLDDLANMLDDLRARVEHEDRDPAAIDVHFSARLPGPGSPEFSSAAHLDALDDLARLGVTWNSVSVPGSSLHRGLEAIEQYGAEVIADGR